MFCANCGKELTGTPDYCPYCGVRNIPVATQSVATHQVGGWNWGAFLLSWIWRIGNNVWISLLALIPYVGFVMAIVLGIKGNEWAWQKKKWDSIEHFKRTQSSWSKWAIGIYLSIVLLSILLAVLIPNLYNFL